MEVALKSIWLSFLLCCHALYSPGQTPWVNAIPTLYHPSFAGSTDQLRIATNNILDLDNFNTSGLNLYRTVINQNHLSVDKFIGKIHTGIGMGLRYSTLTDEGIPRKADYLEGNIAIAPKFSFRGKYTISPSLQITAGKLRDDFSYVDNGFAGPFVMHYPYTVRYICVKAGLMYNTKSFFIGAACIFTNKVYSTLTDPFRSNYSLTFLERLSFIAGYTFRRSEESKFSFTPVLLFGLQPNYWNQFMSKEYHTNIYFNFKYKKAIAGVDLHTNIMFGYEGEKVKIMLVQRYRTQSALGEKAYSAQLSLRCLLGK